MTAEAKMTPAEVGAMFGVTTQTVRKWAKAGLLEAILTPTGKRRYRETEVHALYARHNPQAGAA
jgi:predicted site-specific integrase-resolvase